MTRDDGDDLGLALELNGLLRVNNVLLYFFTHNFCNMEQDSQIPKTKSCQHVLLFITLKKKKKLSPTS